MLIDKIIVDLGGKISAEKFFATKYNAIINWRGRGIPKKHWLRIVQNKKLDITYDNLIHNKK